MKIAKYIISGLLLTLLIVSSAVQAQSRFKSKYLKSVDEARTQAVAGTLVPIALGLGTTWLVDSNTIEKTASGGIIYGLMIGPSFGNFYAKDYLRGMLGVAARVGGGLLMRDATREIFGDDVADAVGWDDEDVSLTDTKILVGGGIVLGSAIYNIISSKASVNRFNRKKGYIVLLPDVRDGKIIPMLSASVHF